MIDVKNNLNVNIKYIARKIRQHPPRSGDNHKSRLEKGAKLFFIPFV